MVPTTADAHRRISELIRKINTQQSFSIADGDELLHLVAHPDIGGPAGAALIPQFIAHAPPAPMQAQRWFAKNLPTLMDAFHHIATPAESASLAGNLKSLLERPSPVTRRFALRAMAVELTRPEYQVVRRRLLHDQDKSIRIAAACLAAAAGDEETPYQELRRLFITQQTFVGYVSWKHLSYPQAGGGSQPAPHRRAQPWSGAKHVAGGLRMSDPMKDITSAVAETLPYWPTYEGRLALRNPTMQALLLPMLAAENIDFRCNAVYGFGFVADDPAVQSRLQATLTDDNEVVRWLTVRALAPLIRQPAVQTALEARLDDPDREVRLEILSACGRGAPTAAVKTAAVAALNDADPAMRAAAATALTPHRDDPEIKPRLETVLGDPELCVRAAGLRAGIPALTDEQASAVASRLKGDMDAFQCKTILALIKRAVGGHKAADMTLRLAVGCSLHDSARRRAMSATPDLQPHTPPKAAGRSPGLDHAATKTLS